METPPTDQPWLHNSTSSHFMVGGHKGKLKAKLWALYLIVSEPSMDSWAEHVHFHLELLHIMTSKSKASWVDFLGNAGWLGHIKGNLEWFMWFENSWGKTAFLLLLETTVQNWKGGKQQELPHHLGCFPFVLS